MNSNPPKSSLICKDEEQVPSKLKAECSRLSALAYSNGPKNGTEVKRGRARPRLNLPKDLNMIDPVPKKTRGRSRSRMNLHEKDNVGKGQSVAEDAEETYEAKVKHEPDESDKEIARRSHRDSLEAKREADCERDAKEIVEFFVATLLKCIEEAMYKVIVEAVKSCKASRTPPKEGGSHSEQSPRRPGQSAKHARGRPPKRTVCEQEYEDEPERRVKTRRVGTNRQLPTQKESTVTVPRK